MFAALNGIRYTQMIEGVNKVAVREITSSPLNLCAEK